jgi:hypothetical protein
MGAQAMAAITHISLFDKLAGRDSPTKNDCSNIMSDASINLDWFIFSLKRVIFYKVTSNILESTTFS